MTTKEVETMAAEDYYNRHCETCECPHCIEIELREALACETREVEKLRARIVELEEKLAKAEQEKHSPDCRSREPCHCEEIDPSYFAFFAEHDYWCAKNPNNGCNCDGAR
jgi:hypothetical protein